MTQGTADSAPRHRGLGRANTRFAVVCALAFACVLALDAYLHDAGGFLRAFGWGTQEGQIQSKMARAGGMAKVADVISFGSSFIRSNLSSEPFLERGLIPLNLGIVGGGPLTNYFALKAIAPVLEARSTKPILLLELNSLSLTVQSDTSWSEYPQYLGIVRSRVEMIREMPLLLPHFRSHGMTSHFVSSVMFPSGLYRSNNVQLFLRLSALDGSFFSTDDFGGYAPVYDVADRAAFPSSRPDAPPIAEAEWQPQKVAFVREFLRLARRLGCPVVLFAAPSRELGHDSAIYDTLIRRLEEEFGPLRTLRTRELHLTPADFGDAHLSIRGADRVTRVVLDWLNVSPSRPVEARIREAFDVYQVPPVQQWKRVAAQAEPANGRFVGKGDTSGLVAGDGPARRRARVWATSPDIPVQPGREAVFEARVQLTRGQLLLRAVGDGVSANAYVMTPLRRPRYSEFRVFLRVRPTSSVVKLEIFDLSAANGREPAIGSVTPLRFWANK